MLAGAQRNDVSNDSEGLLSSYGSGPFASITRAHVARCSQMRTCTQICRPATDGTVRWQTVMYHGRQYGPYVRAFISQSKPQYIDELWRLVGSDGTEQVSPARQRDFGRYVSDCMPQHKFELTSAFVRELFQRAEVQSFLDLPGLTTALSESARTAMLDAMLKGDGSLRRGHSWAFGQKTKPGVTDAFTILATLCGHALGRPRFSSVGEVPVWQLRANRHVSANYLSRTVRESQHVWCPVTQSGTCVINLRGNVAITGGSHSR